MPTTTMLKKRFVNVIQFYAITSEETNDKQTKIGTFDKKEDANDKSVEIGNLNPICSITIIFSQ